MMKCGERDVGKDWVSLLCWRSLVLKGLHVYLVHLVYLRLLLIMHSFRISRSVLLFEPKVRVKRMRQNENKTTRHAVRKRGLNCVFVTKESISDTLVYDMYVWANAVRLIISGRRSCLSLSSSFGNNTHRLVTLRMKPFRRFFMFSFRKDKCLCISFPSKTKESETENFIFCLLFSKEDPKDKTRDERLTDTSVEIP